MALTDILTILEGENLVIEKRVKRYDVKWGKPFGALDYHEYAVAGNPICYYKMEDTEGDSINWGTVYGTDDLTYSGTVDFETSIIKHCDDTAVFNGSIAGATTDNVPFAASGQTYSFAASCWIIPARDASSKTKKEPLIYVGAIGGQSEFCIALSETNTVQVFVNGLTTPLIDSTGIDGGTLVKDKKYHIGVTWNSQDSSRSAELWINGVLIKSIGNVPLPVHSSTSRFAVACLCSTAKVPVNYTTFTMFSGQIEGVALYDHALAGVTFAQQYKLGNSGAYFDPYSNVDTAPVSAVSTGQKYTELITAEKPVHWWGLDEADGAGTAVGKGTTPLNGTYEGTSGNTARVSAVLEEAEVLHSHGFTQPNSFSTVGPLALSGVTAFTMEFWVRFVAHSSDADELVRTTDFNDPSNKAGVYSWVQDKTIGCAKRDKNGNIVEVTHEIPGGFDYFTMDNTTKNGWVYVAYTISDNGVMKLYINGSLVKTVTSDGRGANFNATGTEKFTIAYSNDSSGYGEDLPGGLFDEPALYDRELSADQIRTHYMVGKYGSAYASSYVIGESPGDEIIGYSVTCDELPSLINEEDITGYVAEYHVDRDLTQFVDVGSLTAHDEWSFLTLKEKLVPMTYVTIEERYRNLQDDEDSGWVSLGHFLVEGPAAKTDDASGNVSYGIVLKGVLKLAMLDKAVVRLAADKMTVRRATLKQTRVAGGASEFQCQRPEDPSVYYSNWAETPAVRLYARKFQNKLDNEGVEIKNIPDEIRVKGAAGSIEVVGGKGMIRIDTDFYESSLENGLGNPDPNGGLVATFDRYITDSAPNSDVFDGAQISDIVLDHRTWCLKFQGSNGRRLPSTMFVKTGAAKSKLFKIYKKYDFSYLGGFSDFTTASQLVDGDVSWDTPNYALDRDDIYAAANDLGGQYVTRQTNTLQVRTPLDSIPDNITVTGVEIRVRRRVIWSGDGQQFWYLPWNKDMGANERMLQLTVNGAPVGQNKAVLNRPTDGLAHTNQFWEEHVYGGPNDLWGLTSISVSQARQLGVNIGATVLPSLFGRTYVQVDCIEVKIHYGTAVADDDLYVLKDYNGYVVNPHMAGLAVGDVVQIGDANRPEDVLRKILLRNSFQEVDATRPFYFSLDQVDNDISLGITVPPFESHIEDSWTWDQVMAEMLLFIPPNYILGQLLDGSVKGRNVTQKSTAEYPLGSVMDVAEDSGDYGVYTRIIAVGEGGDSVNVAESSNAAIRAYKLDNWVIGPDGSIVDPDADTSGYSYTKTAANYTKMNGILGQLLDNSQRTPSILPPAFGDPYSYLGVVWNKKGANLHYWDMADQDLFVIDIGKNVAANIPYEIEALQVTHFKTIKEGDGVSQSLLIWYMTEEDYVAEFGLTPPNYPSQNDANALTSYMPPANAVSWKILVDEFNCEDGQKTIESADFEQKRNVKLRFIKVQLGQAHYYEDATDTALRKARIDLTDLKVFTSRNIVATATLGTTAPFETGDFKGMLGRLRLRSHVLDKNVYLDTYEKAAAFARDQLGEFYREFAPEAVSAFCPGIDVGMTISYINPHNGDVLTRLVKSYSYSTQGRAVLQVIDYATGV